MLSSNENQLNQTRAPRNKMFVKPLSYFSAFIACAVMSMLSGCVSGGFQLTRSYAGWVNRQNIILRVILYILTSFIFFITMLIDVVVFNTVDFWEGKISAGEYNFKQGDKTYVVKHEFQPDSKLRLSTIHVLDNEQKQLQEVVLRETPKGEIELFVDGHMRTRVSNVNELPVASIYDVSGKLLRSDFILTPTLVAHDQ